jgi:hypothetical protein
MHRSGRALVLSLVFGALWGCGQRPSESKDGPAADDKHNGRASGAATAARPSRDGPAADGKLTVDLGPVTNILAYQIQPPKGYITTDPKVLEPDEFSWDGPKHQGKPGAMFLVKIWPERSEEKHVKSEVEVGTLTLDDYFTSALARIKPFWVSLQADPPERFTSHGLPFIGTRWKAIDRESQRPFRGFVYVTLSGKQVVEITGNDVEPHHEALFRAAGASVRTLRKR